MENFHYIVFIYFFDVDPIARLITSYIRHSTYMYYIKLYKNRFLFLNNSLNGGSMLIAVIKCDFNCMLL